MTQDYYRLWKDLTSAIDEAEAVRTLAEILVDKDGRAFILRLEREDAELCIEILDHVTCNLPLLPSPALSCDFIRASRTITSNPLRNRFSSSR
jgi:hypothetical protein